MTDKPIDFFKDPEAALQGALEGALEAIRDAIDPEVKLDLSRRRACATHGGKRVARMEEYIASMMVRQSSARELKQLGRGMRSASDPVEYAMIWYDLHRIKRVSAPNG